MVMEKRELRRLLMELEKIRGRHTELVSVYVPAGYNMAEMSSLIKQEQSTAENIKSKTTRKNVVGALEKVAGRIRHYMVPPKNGLVLMAGNISEKEGVSDIKLWEFEPPEPIAIRVYRCDQTFVLEPLQDIVREKEVYGLIVIDTKEAAIGFLRGKQITLAKRLKSIVPGKQIKGGQCLAPGTLVQLEDGDIVEIESIHNPQHIFGADLDTLRPIVSEIADKQENKRVLCKIITKNPRFELCASLDHTFFVRTAQEIKELPLKHVRPGDVLIIPEKITVRGRTQTINTSEKYVWLALKRSGAALIRAKREGAGFSQESLAKKLGLHQAGISRIERRHCNFRREFLLRVLHALDIDGDEFVRSHCQPAFDVRIPKNLTGEFAQLLGYFVGDGNFDENKLSFSEGDKRTALHYSRLATKIFGVRSSLRHREGKNYWVIRIYSLPLVRTMRKEFPEITGARTTKIPSKILKSPENVLAAFLRGFFDADGYVSSNRVAIGVNNKKLAQMTQLALLRFGILSSILEYDAKKNPYSKHHRFTVSLVDQDSMKIFEHEIGFDSPAKASKLKRLALRPARASYTRQIILSGSQVKRQLQEMGSVLRELRAPDFLNDRREMSKVAFKRLLARIEDKETRGRLAKVLDYGLLPVEVSSITPLGPQNTVDISVGKQNFFANGILVHNSAPRFQRVRQELLHSWKKEVGEVARANLEQERDLRGIIIGGPGLVKDEFLHGDFLPTALKNKVLGVKDLGYSGEEGLKELVERSQDLLKEAAIFKEKQLLTRFLDNLRKEAGLAAYGKEKVAAALERAAVDLLILSERFEENEAEEAEKLRAAADATGANVTVVSEETPEGQQFQALGGVGAILRFKV